MITAFLLQQIDYVFFLYGLGFLLLAVGAQAMAESRERPLPWLWLAAFGLTHGINEWLDMLVPATGDCPLFALGRTLVAAASFVCLLEFGRRSVERPKRVGAWLTSILCVVALSGGLKDADALAACVRYALAFPGALWAAWAIWRCARRDGAQRPSRSLMAVSLVMVVYGFAGGLVVPPGDLPPAALLNTAVFLDYTGVPVQVIRGALACLMAAALWRWHCGERRRRGERAMVEREMRREDLAAGGFLVILVVGWLATEVSGRRYVADRQDALLRVAQSAAAMVDARDLALLSGSPDDKQLPVYTVLRDRCQRLGKMVSGLRYVYIMCRRGADIIFLVDTEPDTFDQVEDPPNAEPGTRYEDAPRALLDVFWTGQAATAGPYTDKWGSFVSGFVPLTPYEGRRPQFVLGVDLDASRWTRMVAGQRLVFIIVTALIEGLLLLFVVLWRTSHEASEALAAAQRGLETRVRERTEELRQANEGLRAEMAERRRAEDERSRLEERMRHAQKMESLGVMAGGVAHDFNNILMAILGNIELAQAEVPASGSVRDYLAQAEKAARRAADLARQMLAYSGRGPLTMRAVDVNTLIYDMQGMLEALVPRKHALQLNCASALPCVKADATQMQQVLMNLVINASEAIGDRSGMIAISTGCVYCNQARLSRTWMAEGLPEGTYVFIEVVDNGCGMDAATVERVFDPFFSTKFTGRGLGLAAALGIVRGHTGAIEVQSDVGKGTTFRLLLPSTPEDIAPAGTLTPRRDGWQGHGTALLVDDEEPVLVLGKRMLERLGFKVLVSRNGREAIDLFRQHQAEIVCVLLDLTMPELDGREAAEALRAIRPDVRVVLCSGYSEEEVARLFDGWHPRGILHKPYSGEDLATRLHDLFSAPPA